MRVPTKEELEEQRGCPEDQLILIDQEIIACYHSIFLQLAREAGLSSDDDDLYSYDLQPDPSEFTITVNPLDADDDILEEVKRRRSTPRGYDPLFMQHYIKDKRGIEKNMGGLIKQLDMAIQVFSLMQGKGANYGSVSYDMDLFPRGASNQEVDAAIKKVERHYKKAQKLIKAAADGTFCEKLSEPIRK